MNQSEPRRVYLLSDCFGGRSVADFPFRDPDIDADIATDFRSFPREKFHRRYDIFGKPEITDHILRHICRLTRQAVSDIGITGVFINSAPRVDVGKNGDEFFLATAEDSQIRIVSPLQVLSAIRAKVERLFLLPNQGNGLHGDHEQFRSSFVPRILHPDHGIQLEEKDPAAIPQYPEGITVAYADRFGNLVLHAESEASEAQVQSLLSTQNISRTVRLRIGQVDRMLQVTTSLSAAEPGKLSIYKNDDAAEVVRKMVKGETEKQMIHASAFAAFEYPKLRTAVEFNTP